MPNNRDLGPSVRRRPRHPLAARRPRVRTAALGAATAALAALALGACGDDGGGDEATAAAPFAGCEIVGGSATTATRDLGVQLGDFVVVPSASSVAAGAVRVAATNIGTHAHELVVVKADGIAALPTEKDGSLAEEKLADLALTGEIEEFPPTEQCDATFDLEPGKYVLLCNLVEKLNGKTVVHLREGMATTFTVTG